MDIHEKESFINSMVCVYSEDGAQIFPYQSVTELEEKVIRFFTSVFNNNSNPMTRSRLYKPTIDKIVCTYSSRNLQTRWEYPETGDFKISNLNVEFPMGIHIDRFDVEKIIQLRDILSYLLDMTICSVRVCCVNHKFDTENMRYELHLEQNEDRETKEITSQLIIDCFNIGGDNIGKSNT